VADKVRRTSTKLAECPLKAVARVRIPSGLLHVTAFDSAKRPLPSLTFLDAPLHKGLGLVRDDSNRLAQFTSSRQVGPGRGLRLLDLVIGEGEVEGGDGVGEVVGLGGADYRRGDDGPPKQQAIATWAMPSPPASATTRGRARSSPPCRRRGAA
jgi:hypothetical protein